MPETIDPRWLLVKTCQDLARKSKSPELYDKLRMAGLLYQLLIGTRALLEQTDSEPRPEFWFREPHENDAQSFKTAYGFDASHRQLAGAGRKTGVVEFLGARVVFFDQWFSVEQMITTVAHVYGGQYGAIPEGLRDEAMANFVSALRLQGAAGVIPVALQEITGVALRGLVPLAGAKRSAPSRAAQTSTAEATSASACPFGGADLKLPS